MQIKSSTNLVLIFYEDRRKDYYNSFHSIIIGWDWIIVVNVIINSRNFIQWCDLGYEN